jgi:branched-chain amino acid transport system substrate-binding protein
MRRLRPWFALTLSLALLLSGCAASGRQVVTIASLSPLTQGNTANGQAISNGVKMAVLEQRQQLATLGFTLGFTALDDQGSPDVGPVVAAQAVANDESILAIVGTYNSGVAIPTSAALLPYHVAMVSPANTAVAVTDRGLPNVNRIVGRDDLQGGAAARFIRYTLQAAHVYVVHDDQTYGRGLAEQVVSEAKRLGLQVDGNDELKDGVRHPDDPDRKGDLGENQRAFEHVQQIVRNIAAAQSPAVFFGGEYPSAALLVRLMREQGIRAAFISGDGIDNSAFSKMAGANADGVYYTSVANPVYETTTGRAWADRYRKLINAEPEAYSVYGYDCAMVIIKALVDFAQKNPGARITRERLMTLVRQTSGFVGVATHVTFDHKGDNKDAQLYLFQVQLKTRPYPGILLGHG